MNCLAPEYLSDRFTKRSSISTYKTRTSQLLNIPLFRTAAGQRTFYNNSIDLEHPAAKFKVKPIVSAIQEQVEEDTFNELLLAYFRLRWLDWILPNYLHSMFFYCIYNPQTFIPKNFDNALTLRQV